MLGPVRLVQLGSPVVLLAGFAALIGSLPNSCAADKYEGLLATR